MSKPYYISITAILLKLRFVKLRQGKLINSVSLRVAKSCMTDLFAFVGQGAHKNTYKNALKAKIYKAYGGLVWL